MKYFAVGAEVTRRIIYNLRGARVARALRIIIKQSLPPYVGSYNRLLNRSELLADTNDRYPIQYFQSRFEF
jgi:hypothetical protein